MPRRKKADEIEEGTEPEERHEIANSAIRAEDRQIDGIKTERKAVIETRIVADLGMKKGDFGTAYKLYQMSQDERDTLFDAIRECFTALGIGQQLNWLDAAG